MSISVMKDKMKHILHLLSILLKETVRSSYSLSSRMIIEVLCINSFINNTRSFILDSSYTKDLY